MYLLTKSFLLEGQRDGVGQEEVASPTGFLKPFSSPFWRANPQKSAPTVSPKCKQKLELL